MDIQIPLLVIGRRVVSVMSAWFPKVVIDLRFGDARVVMGNSMWLPKVVRSPG